MPDVVKASASMPFAFPHTHLDSHSFVDGGSVWNLDLPGAIQRCKEVVKDDKDIIVDVVLCSARPNITDFDYNSTTVTKNFIRYDQIRNFYGSLSDYCEVKRGFPEINFRYVVGPEEILPTQSFPLVFDHDEMQRMIKLGEIEGKKVIDGSQNWLQKYLAEYDDVIY